MNVESCKMKAEKARISESRKKINTNVNCILLFSVHTSERRLPLCGAAFYSTNALYALGHIFVLSSNEKEAPFKNLRYSSKKNVLFVTSMKTILT